MNVTINLDLIGPEGSAIETSLEYELPYVPSQGHQILIAPLERYIKVAAVLLDPQKPMRVNVELEPISYTDKEEHGADVQRMFDAENAQEDEQ